MKSFFLSILSLLSFAVTAQDITPPTAVCKDIILELNAEGTASIAPEDLDGGSSDDAGIVSFTASQIDFDCFSFYGQNTVTLTVTDAADNASSCDAIVTVVDLLAPQNLTGGYAEADINEDGTTYVDPWLLLVDGQEGCAVSLTASQDIFTCENIGENIIELTLTDMGGNSATTTATVVVRDLLPPAAVCKNISVELDNTGNANINAGDLDNGSTDQCGVAGFDASQTNFTAANIGNNLVTLTITDVNGNTSTCDATVTVTQTVDVTTLLSSYTVIAIDAFAGKRNTVSNGGVGVTKAGAKATFENNSVVTAPTTFVKASIVELKTGSIVTNKTLSNATISLPAELANPYTSSKKNLTVADNATVTTNDSVFATIAIGKNAKVTFTNPRIFAKSYEAKEGSTVNFATCTQIAVTDFVTLRKNSKTNTDLKNVTFHVKTSSAGNEFTFEAGVTFNGNAYASTGEIVTLKATAAAPSRLTGQFIAKKVTADEYTTWNWNTAINACGAPALAAEQPASAARMIQEEETEAPAEKRITDALETNAYPNPFNAITTIRFIAVADEKTRLAVYNISGQEVQTLFEGNTEAGKEYTIQFDGSDQPAGLYFYRLETAERTLVNKLLLTK